MQAAVPQLAAIALALTPDGAKLYVTLPGREGYPDWRVAVGQHRRRGRVTALDRSAAGRAAARHAPGRRRGLAGNTAISARPYAVVANQYANFATRHRHRHRRGASATSRPASTARISSSTRPARGSTSPTASRTRSARFAVDRGPTFTQIAEIPTGSNDLDRANPRDLAISADGTTLYVANTLGHTIAVINIAGDANTLVTNDAGRRPRDRREGRRAAGASSPGTRPTTCSNQPETGHGLPKIVNGVAIRNNGQPLGYTPVMTDATRATTFDDLGSELNVFDTATQPVRLPLRRLRARPVDARGARADRRPGRLTRPARRSSAAAAPSRCSCSGDLLFVSQLHSDKVEVFRDQPEPGRPVGHPHRSSALEFTGGITPQGLAVSPDGRTVYVANMQTEDVSFLGVGARRHADAAGLPRRSASPTARPIRPRGAHGQHLFATHEEVGLRWLFTQSYSDDGQKSCGHCHWQSRHDGGQWNVGANAIGGPKVCPQNKDISDNWPEWFEGLSSDMNSYASSCNGELVVAERHDRALPAGGSGRSAAGARRVRACRRPRRTRARSAGRS